MTKKGIDISEHQGNVNFNKVKNDGIQFLILRQGVRKRADYKFFQYVQQATEAGIPIYGVYHFSYALSIQDAIEEAKVCIANVQYALSIQDAIEETKICIANVQQAELEKEDITIFYDFEYDTVDDASEHGIHLGKTECIAFTRAFCDYIQSQGYKAGIYTNLDYYNRMYDAATISLYDFWLAQYNNGATPKFNCQFHQYSSSGRVNGINGNVDMNLYYGEKQKRQEKTTPRGTSAEDILNVMRSWIGKSLPAGTHKDIIDLYNSHKPLAMGYAVTYSDDYCDTTISAAFIKCNAVDLIGGTQCGVERHINIFKNKGIWQEDGSVKPQPGWIITYNWDDGTQPNDGWADHIGIVQSVNGNIITTIEGNINGGVVGRSTLQVANGFIRGYAIPKYAEAGSSNSKPSTPTTSPTPQSKKSAIQIAKEVIQGINGWGNGDERITKLAAAGYNPTQIQNKINELLGYSIVNNKENDLIATSPNKFTYSKGVSPNRVPYFVAQVTADSLYVRSWAGMEYSPIKTWPILGYSNLIDVCDSIQDKNGETWYYIRIDGSIYGFSKAEFIQQI